MTQEEKQLLLIDLCGRVPYDIKLEVVGTGIRPLMSVNYINRDTIYINSLFELGEVEIKPYLRPMSSITEEEKIEIRKLKDSFDFNCYAGGDYSFQLNLAIANWFNKNMFDYRGLIPMGLALEAPKEMYKKGE